jgi:hypothetical protein
MTEGRQEPGGAPSERSVTLSAIVPASVAGMVPPEQGNPQRHAFYAVAPAAAAAYWGSSLADGLSGDEAEKRLARLGPNKLAEPRPPSLLRRLLAQISDCRLRPLGGAPPPRRDRQGLPTRQVARDNFCVRLTR